MHRTRSLLILGFVFLANGPTFLAVGLATHLLALWALAPAFIALGIAFLALARARAKACDGLSTSDGST